MSEFPFYGVVRVSDEVTRSDSVLRWFQDVGGIAPSPGHKTGAPASDGADESVTLRLLDNEVLEGECNRVLVMPATQFGPLLTTPPAGFRLVGLPMDIDILLGETSFDQRGLPICTQSQAETHLCLTLAYDQKAIDRLGIAESELRIFRYTAGQGWVEPVSQSQTPPPLQCAQGSEVETASVAAPATTVDTDLNWVATMITATSAIYAIGVLSSGK